MKKLLISIFVSVVLLPVSAMNGQVIMDTVSLISAENIDTKFCFNNSKLMAGNSVSDRYIVYYNSETILLNILQSGVWEEKIAYTGSNTSSATMTFHRDTIWICWKQGPFIKARYTPDKGVSWSNVLSVSPAGNVASPSIYASSNGKIHFVWSATSDSDTAVYYNVYHNGVFLPEPKYLSNTGSSGYWPNVIAIGDTVLSAWKEGIRPSKVWFRSSFDGGRSWNPLPSRPTTDLLSASKDPNLAYAYDATTNTHHTYLAYDGQNMIYLQHSIDFGNIWSESYAISSPNKWSQFAHIESNNKGFVGVSYEQRPVGSSLYDDTQKDVGFTYSTDWGKIGTFSNDTLAYTHNGFGSAYPAFNKIDEKSFYLAWLTEDTVSNKKNVFERLVHFNNANGIDSYERDTRSSIRISPNPFSVQTSLLTDMASPNTSLMVYNSYGQIVKQIDNLSGKIITFYRDNLPIGLYFIRLIQDNNNVATDKIIIVD